MTLHFKTVPTWPEWNLESVLEGAVISQIILLENPPEAGARLCVEGVEWRLSLAPTNTDGVYRIVFSDAWIDGVHFYEPQASQTGNTC